MPNIHSFSQHNLVTLLDPPADQASANSSWLLPFADGNGAERAVFMLVVGDVSAEEIDLALWQAKDSGGTGAKAITGAAITQISASDDNLIKTIEIGPGALDDVNGYKYVQARVTVDNAGTENFALVLIRYGLRYPGVTAQDSTYAEAVEVFN